MLVLSRTPSESIHIGDDIRIEVIRIKNNIVQIGIEAPREIRVRRGEKPDVQDVISDEKTAEGRERTDNCTTGRNL